MPLKKSESNKRYISSDSEESNLSESPKKSSFGAKRLDGKRSEQMVNLNNSYDIRLSNGRVNGLSMDRTNAAINTSINSSLNPFVSLNRDVVETHLKRKSLGSSAPKPTTIEERDEREERRIRQNERAIQQRRSGVGLIGTPSRAPTTSTGTAMSSKQLVEHYTHCIQLSTSNKINVKNAFGLHLIDYMSELIKQSDSNQTNGFVNFKLAGSALDAGAKIYCHRVDSVHAEAQKVASSLVMALNNDKNAGNNGISDDMNADNDNQMDDQNDGMDDENGQQRQKRKKTTKRNVKTLAQNIDSLNVTKVETNLEIDPVFHHLTSSFDMGNVNSLLMANLMVSPSGMLLLDSNSSLNFDNYSNNNESKTQDIQTLCNTLTEVSKCSAQICPKLSSFEFLNRNNGIDLIPREEDPSFRRDNFAFDLNAEVEDMDDIDCEDMGAADLSDNDEDSIDKSCDGITEAPEAMRKSLIRAVNMQGVGDLVKMLSDRPNDYTYFNPKLLSSWAGPMHWKRMPFWQKKDKVDGQPFQEGDKPRRQRRLFPESHYPKDEFDEEEADCLGGNDQKLKVATLQKWQLNSSELKLPADHGFDPKVLARSFIKPESNFQCAKSNEDVMDTTINSNNTFDAPTSPGMERYDYDDDDDIPTGGFTDPLDLGLSAPLSQLNANTNVFIGDNLVEQPIDLMQYNITFAKFAKKMDVKRLKKAMWDVIAPEANSSMTTQTINGRKSPTDLNFIDLYKTLPQKITPVMSQNLSAPIAFVTLLHLCNERNLNLIGSEDLSDFVIEQEVFE